MLKRLLGIQAGSPLLEAAVQDLTGMLDHSKRMLDLALAALLENSDLVVDLDKMDDAVDESERMVRRTVLQHLSVNPRQDLVASLILVSTVQDAERIGDFARGMGELTRLAGSRREGPFAQELADLTQRLGPMFQSCRRAFGDDEPDEARKVLASHVALKQACIEFTRRVAKSDLTADMAIVYAAGARITRRISAHLSNIASTVVQPFDRIRRDDEEP
jgi:phosphate uptake regulator